MICHGCGQSFDVAASHTRNKIQCPVCGVICVVPAGEARKAAPARQAKRAEEAPPEPTFEDDAPIEADVAEQPMTVSCRRCGRKIPRQRECPACDAVPEIPLGEDPIPRMQLGEAPTPQGDDEDDSPYVLRDKLGPTCPKCRAEMPLDSVVCVKCGFNRRTRKKAARTYQLIDRVWESDRTLSNRLMWLLAAQGFHIFLALLFGPFFGTYMPFIISWFPLMTLLLFIFGTFDRIQLTRDERGRSKITKQWRFAFVPLTPVTTEIRGFEGVVSGPWMETGVTEWAVLIGLLLWGFIPGLIWYYFTIHTPHFMVALSLDHGHPEVYVYRGRNQNQMNEIADAVCAASALQRLA